MRRAFAIVVVALLALARAWSAPPWPDDWDGVGFVLAIRRFDLDAFTPHAPGYPVYVAMLKIAARATPDPIAAANGVAVVTGVAAVLVAWSAARRLLDAERATWIAASIALLPLVWRASTAIGSEAPALFFLALAAWGIARGGWLGAIALGAGVGLGLGVRLSWAPLFVPLFAVAPRGGRLRAIAVAALFTAAWAIPFVAGVGAAHLRALVEAQAAGHFTRWGGTAIVDPGAARAWYLARDLFVDGLGAGADPLGIAIAFLTVAVLARGVVTWREHDWAHAREAAIVLAPYLVWILVGQNLRAQPRHALPIVAALGVAIALVATSSTRTRQIAGALVFVAALRTASDASERRDVPPPGAQLVERVRGLPDRDRVAVFGETSVRFFALTELADRALPAATLGDVALAVGRLPSLPSRLLVTKEVDGASSPPATPFATLCRPARLDRRAPCLTVYERPAP